MVYVTHDQVEAMTLADKIVVMNDGRIEQVGTPRELYETPANVFVATFIGSPKMAMVDVERNGDSITLKGSPAIPLPDLPQAANGKLKLGIRPDSLKLTRTPDASTLPATIVYTEYLGENAFVYARLTDGSLVGIRTGPDDLYQPDEPVGLGIDAGAAHFFSAEDGRRLSAP
jgi:multiple sugar transport system ATP-binding protein